MIKNHRTYWSGWRSTVVFAVLVSAVQLFSANAFAATAFVQTAASTYSSQSGTQLENASEGGQDVAFIDNGDFISFSNVDFASGAAALNMRVASAGQGGKIELHTDS